MKIKKGQGSTKYGPGVEIKLKGDEVALAIMAWLTAKDCHISGPRTITIKVDEESGLIESGRIYVDPSGKVIHKGKEYSGRG